MDMIVDCDQEPSVPPGFTIAHHIPVELKNVAHITHWTVRRCLPNLLDIQTVRGILEDIRELRPTNACVLDYLLQNQEKIPQRLENALFWGTGFRTESAPEELYLQRLVKEHGGWRSQMVRISAQTPLLIYGPAVWLCS